MRETLSGRVRQYSPDAEFIDIAGAREYQGTQEYSPVQCAWGVCGCSVLALAKYIALQDLVS